MTKSIYIIDLDANGLPEPDSLRGLWSAIQPLLHRERDEPNPKYVLLAQGLAQTMRARAGSKASEEQIARDLDQPVHQAAHLKKALWQYELPGWDSMEVLHEIVRQAQEHDLAVMADHLGVAFLPGGKVVADSGDPEEWAMFFADIEDLRPAPQSRARMKERVVAMMDDKLKPHGFQLLKPGKGMPKMYGEPYWKRVLPDAGWHIVTLPDEVVGGSLGFSPACGGIDARVHAVLRRAPVPGFLARVPSDAIQMQYVYDLNATPVGLEWRSSLGEFWRSGPPFPVEEADRQFRVDAAEELTTVASTAFAELLNRMSTTQGIDQVLNKEVDRAPGVFVRKNGRDALVAITSAHLTGNPDFDLIVEACTSGLNASSERLKEIQNLVKFLKAEVHPVQGSV